MYVLAVGCLLPRAVARLLYSWLSKQFLTKILINIKLLLFIPGLKSSFEVLLNHRQGMNKALSIPLPLYPGSWLVSPTLHNDVVGQFIVEPSQQERTFVIAFAQFSSPF
jgi:hypothetical protein